LISLFSCRPENPVIDAGSDWNIPRNEIIWGGVSKDGIPSLFNPRTTPADQADYLSDDDLVVGLVVNSQARAYPHTILDWHEVINEDFDSETRLTLSYCPLTGTAIVFDGRIRGQELTFGVSGFLYNNNLIMFDRQTDSRWPQMRLQSDQGELKDVKQKVYPSIETSWGTWKKLYPNTVILSTDTGHQRSYDSPGSAYPGYNDLFSGVFYPISFFDRTLPPKQRVHGILVGEGPNDYKAKAYLIDSSKKRRLINDTLDGNSILVIDSGVDNFVVSYSRKLDDRILVFSPAGEIRDFPFIFIDDQTGSSWNLLGEAVAGPLTGSKLEQTLSYNAYWFAWGAFYTDSDIYLEDN